MGHFDLTGNKAQHSLLSEAEHYVVFTKTAGQSKVIVSDQQSPIFTFT
jgi:hypothetical protein